MQKLLPVLLLSALSLAGCSGSSDHTDLADVACPDGSVLTGADQEAMPDHHGAGFNATSHCPIAPSVSLTGLPAELGAFMSASFTWTLDNGSVLHGHSMLSSLRWSTRSVPEADLTNMNKYPNELVKREHQDVPAKFEGKLSFSSAGKVYLRAYSQIQGEDYAKADFWSDEVVLTILPVQPTGTVVDLVHTPGDFLGTLTESADLQLGDAVRLDNEDVVEHKLTYISGPVNPGDITAPMQGPGEPVVFDVPGVYQFNSDDRQAKTVTIRVAEPA